MSLRCSTASLTVTVHTVHDDAPTFDRSDVIHDDLPRIPYAFAA
ncbi:hypothetical protein [Roseiconus lacunae]|uniref:Uncharacterized protein n=1 Tax=Roseiconus lacunae TaxID=2605694 RepID=A0ABT7PRT1_9BACT|nr:hypothetical protein [Roseiconus lacunae]MDM4018994.1 hypothetical protein [Roseiconus lacunae]